MENNQEAVDVTQIIAYFIIKNILTRLWLIRLITEKRIFFL